MFCDVLLIRFHPQFLFHNIGIFSYLFITLVHGQELAQLSQYKYKKHFCYFQIFYKKFKIFTFSKRITIFAAASENSLFATGVV